MAERPVSKELLPLFEHLRALGMKPEASGTGLEAAAHFQKLVNAFSQEPILGARLKNFGSDRVLLTKPMHLSHLPAIRAQACPTPEAFEFEVHRLYHRRLERMHEASEFLRRRRIKIEVDEHGFRVLGIITINGREIRFTLREGMMAQIVTIGGSSLERIIDARERRVEVRNAVTSAELEMILEPLVAALYPRVVDAEATTGTYSAARELSAADPDAQADESILGGPIPQFDYGRGELTDPGAESSQPGAEEDSGELIGLVCNRCGTFYLVDPATPDYRLLQTCPKCLGGG